MATPVRNHLVRRIYERAPSLLRLAEQRSSRHSATTTLTHLTLQEWNRAVAEGWVPPVLLGSMPASPATNWVPMSEVANHYRFEDAWTVIRGKVYNVTPYLKIHPGGEAQLMKVAGKLKTSESSRCFIRA